MQNVEYCLPGRRNGGVLLTSFSENENSVGHINIPKGND